MDIAQLNWVGVIFDGHKTEERVRVNSRTLNLSTVFSKDFLLPGKIGDSMARLLSPNQSEGEICDGHSKKAIMIIID